MTEDSMPKPLSSLRPWLPRWLATAASATILSTAALSTTAAELTLRVTDRDGNPFEGAVVELQHPSLLASSGEEERVRDQAAMDQINKQFAPHLLVVEQGTPVVFPNSDSIKHHVYSFSAAKRFQIKLYKDQQPDPLIFDKPGVVALGCNIHDWMVGYIYVAQSTQVTQTDAKGLARFDLADNLYQAKIWHPRFKSADAKREVQVRPQASTHEFQLTETLHPKIDDQADEFESY